MMNRLTKLGIGFWLASGVSIFWTHFVSSSFIESDLTLKILHSLAFICFINGLGLFIVRIIQKFLFH
jgi:hypothetical protein